MGKKILTNSTNELSQITDILVSTFPKIIDCPDIITELIRIWHEDVMYKYIYIIFSIFSNVSTKSKRMKAFELLFPKFEEIVTQLYLIVNATEFLYQRHDPTGSASGNQELYATRRKLIEIALRGDNAPKKK